MRSEELKLDQIEDYARMRLDVSVTEVSALVGCSKETAIYLLRELVHAGRFVRRGDCYAKRGITAAAMRTERIYVDTKGAA